MNTSIQFDKFKCEEITIYNCKDGGWQLSKENGLHKCSPARDYLVKWVQYNGKWSLYITNYNSIHDTYLVFLGEQRSHENSSLSTHKLSDKFIVDNFIITLDTLFDVFDYISENRHTHY